MLKLPEDWEKYRVTSGPCATTSDYRNGGYFTIPSQPGLRRPLDVIVNDGRDQPEVSDGWEHASVKARINHSTYTPTWDEMCWVKEQLWDLEDTVVQFHPPRSRYFNVHANVLHLWRNASLVQSLPPRELL